MYWQHLAERNDELNRPDSDSQGLGHEALKALVLSLRFLPSIQLCVYVCVCVHMNAETLGIQKRSLDAVDLELQVSANGQMWVLGATVW